VRLKQLHFPLLHCVVFTLLCFPSLLFCWFFCLSCFCLFLRLGRGSYGSWSCRRGLGYNGIGFQAAIRRVKSPDTANAIAKYYPLTKRREIYNGHEEQFVGSSVHMPREPCFIDHCV